MQTVFSYLCLNIMSTLFQVKNLEPQQLHFLEGKINKFRVHLLTKICKKIDISQSLELQDRVSESNLVTNDEMKDQILNFLQNPLRPLQKEFRFNELNTRPILRIIHLLSHIPPAKIDIMVSRLSKQINHKDIHQQDMQKIGLYLNCLSDIYVKC